MTNTYRYKNKKFHSIKDLAKYAEIHEKTLAARLRKGMSIEDACDSKDLRCRYSCYKSEHEKSIAQLCRENNKDADLVNNRLHYGYSLYDALNKPKKISRQGKPIIVNGILYNSVSEAARMLGMPEKESTIRSRLRIGYKPDDAFNFD
jgi:hypothetical protein